MRGSVVRATPSAHHRFHVLDGLRGLVAALVVCWHAPAYLQLHAGHKSYLGVDVFFCLSGFVIAFSYERRLAAWMTVRQFMAARLIRLYPIFALGVVLGIVGLVWVRPVFAHTQHARLLASIGMQSVMLPSIRLPDSDLLYPLNPPAWSLAMEMVVNVLFAFAVRKRLAGTRTLVLVCTVSLLVVTAALARVTNLNVGFSLYRSQILYGLARVCYSFFAGVLILRLARKHPRAPFSRPVSLFATVGIGLLVVLFLQTPVVMLRGEAMELLTVACFIPVLVYLGSRCSVPTAWVPMCVVLGDLSYPVYLIHYPFMHLLGLPRVQAFVLASPWRQHLAFPVVLLLLCAVSHAALKFYDVPVRAWLQRRWNAGANTGTPLVNDSTKARHEDAAMA